MSYTKKVFQKAVLVVLMLQILNLSIYNTNFYDVFSTETSDCLPVEENPIDSFAELILEEFAGIDNAFPEQGNSNNEKSTNVKPPMSMKLFARDYFPGLPTIPSVYVLKKKHPHTREDYRFLFVDKISHPPAYLIG